MHVRPFFASTYLNGGYYPRSKWRDHPRLIGLAIEEIISVTAKKKGGIGKFDLPGNVWVNPDLDQL